MNRRRPFQIPVACGILALVAACLDQNESDHNHPRYSHDYALTPSHPSAAIAIERGAALRIILPGPPAGSDYAWEIVSNNTHQLEQRTALIVTQAPTGQTTSVGFYSLKLGKSIVRFVLVRPSDRDAIPKGHFEVTVVSKDPDD